MHNKLTVLLIATLLLIVFPASYFATEAHHKLSIQPIQRELFISQGNNYFNNSMGKLTNLTIKFVAFGYNGPLNAYVTVIVNGTSIVVPVFYNSLTVRGIPFGYAEILVKGENFTDAYMVYLEPKGQNNITLTIVLANNYTELFVLDLALLITIIFLNLIAFNYMRRRRI